MKTSPLSAFLIGASLAVGIVPAGAFTPKPNYDAGVPAFPGAEGAGMYSLGGRGGKVLKVTTLEDSGPGSLRAAIDAKGPRTVVFEISGTIALATPLEIREPRITIAGQTAPGDGITIRNQSLIVSTDDVVIRYIRSRLGDEGKAESDAIWVRSGRRIILDHVSASWSIDETLSVNNPFRDPAAGFYDVTVQWSIISESLNDSLHVKGPHGYGSLIAGGFGTKISFHHNLWAHHNGRNPRPGNPAQPERDSVGAFHDYRSNVFYDWGGEHAGYNADTGLAKRSIVKYNFVDNFYLTGSASKGRIAFNESNELAQAYFAGNMMDFVMPDDPWSLTSGKNGAGWRLARPVDVGPVKPDPARSAFDRVLESAGASLVRDMVDQRVVESVRRRTGGLINSQSDVGGWPMLKTLPPLLDTDDDGMPDFWERETGLDPSRDDGANTLAGDPYTHLERYLNEIVPARNRALGARPSVNGIAFASIATAIASLPASGGEVLLAPGEYREKLLVDRTNVTLRGAGVQPNDVVIVWGDGAANVGGTSKSFTMNVVADDFRAENLTIQNDYQTRELPQTQAVALFVTGDRAVFDRVRLLGAQDTLYAASKKCAEGTTCQTSRQLFRNCYIEGHVDFIFGDANAFFDRCRIHALKHPEVMITAHSRTAPEQDKAYVFDRCTVTADPGTESIWLGRPWRDYARVIFLNTTFDAAIHPAGWREWTPGKTNRLPLAYYAEYKSRGKNATLSTREPHAKRLTAKEAKEWTRKRLFGDWDPK
jgi:pectin methylesterase-like acyl-CoA thioesterase/pectate lyase